MNTENNNRNRILQPLSVTSSCVGCGNCEAVCPEDAVHTTTGLAKLVTDSCTAFDGTYSRSGQPKCLICVRFCPVKDAFVVNGKEEMERSYEQL